MGETLVIACRLGVILAATVLLPLLAVCGLPVTTGPWSRAFSSWIAIGQERNGAPLSQPFEMPSQTLRYHAGPLPVGLAVGDGAAPHSQVTQVAFHEPAGATDAGGMEADTADPAQRRALERLRDLGATFYRLRPWGADAGLFRFETRVALDADAALQRYFEAVDTNPLTAMERVLAEVESWRANRVH